MSKRAESSAAVVRIKGVSFNYLQFLWGQLQIISQARQQGNYPVAMKLCVELIVWLPRSLKNEFLKRALIIQADLLRIRSNTVPQLKAIQDFHQRAYMRNKLLTMYSATALTSFINDLTTKLDSMGYMENTKEVTEGSAEDHGEGQWTNQADYENIKNKGKHKGSPTGTMME